MAPRPLSERPTDQLIFLFLLSYIPVIIFFDAAPLYPRTFPFTTLQDLHHWYETTFHDPFSVAQQPWFHFFALSEIAYQLPAAAWMARLLARDDARAPVHALPWAVWCAGTTATCLWELAVDGGVAARKGVEGGQRAVLAGLYGGYGLVFVVIGVIMFNRIQRALVVAADRKSQ